MISSMRDAEEWFKSAILNKQVENYSICVYALEMAIEIALKFILIPCQIITEIFANIKKRERFLEIY